MRVLFCSAEVAPFAKVGGLADVAGSLPKALEAMGHEVVVVMPAYGYVVNDPKYGVRKVKEEFFVRVNESRFVKGTLYACEYHGLKVWLIDGEDRFATARESKEVYSFGREDYLFFSQAALEACHDMNWMPDVVHAHDWHMGFIPVMLREARSGEWDKVASTFTIHNLAYQGEFPYDTLEAAGVSAALFNKDQLECYGAVNFLKAGCVFSDQMNTVSPNYAHEIQTAEFGCRLEGLMAHLHAQHRLRGILNGIDEEVWDPANDPAIVAAYSAEDRTGKQACRADLVKIGELSVADDKPIFGVVSRLSNQKGFDLILANLPRIAEAGGALVVQGLGDPWAAGELRAAAERYPGKVAFFEVFDADLAQKVYAGSDAFLMPSAFEPCGLGQMFAMRYGTVPIVRHTGGLADTVFENINGFVFHDRHPDALGEAIDRCLIAFGMPSRWQMLMDNGMNEDFSWSKSAKEYVRMYEDAIQVRREARVTSGSAS